MLSLLGAGVRIYVAEVADYEVRRELLRLQNAAGLERLDALHDLARYVPLTTEAMREAARLWAKARIDGKPTADPHALDGDVILAAQALTSGLSHANFVIATTNVSHLARFVAAQEWNNIKP